MGFWGGGGGATADISFDSGTGIYKRLSPTGTNDHSALATCMSDVSTGGGGVVEMLPGDWDMAGTVALLSNVHLRAQPGVTLVHSGHALEMFDDGGGTLSNFSVCGMEKTGFRIDMTLAPANTISKHTFLLEANQHSNYAICNLEIEGIDSNSGFETFLIRGDEVFIDNITCEDGREHFQQSAGTISGVIQNFRSLISVSGGTAFVLVAPRGLTVQDLDVDGAVSPTNAIALSASDTLADVAFVNPRVDGGTAGMLVTRGGIVRIVSPEIKNCTTGLDCDSVFGATRLSIEGGTVESCTIGGDFDRMSQLVIDGTRFQSNVSHGLSVSQCRNSLIDVFSFSNGGDGIRFDDNGTANHSKVTGTFNGNTGIGINEPIGTQANACQYGPAVANNNTGGNVVIGDPTSRRVAISEA